MRFHVQVQFSDGREFFPTEGADFSTGSIVQSHMSAQVINGCEFSPTVWKLALEIIQNDGFSQETGQYSVHLNHLQPLICKYQLIIYKH